MGSSNRKKKEKKQDFQKQKLKVGKSRPKNTNATDTSFVAKTISLKEQSLSENAPEKSARFHLQLSLVGSRNEPQRKDALAYLAHTLSSSKSTQDGLPVSAGVIISKAQHLIMDESVTVRSNLLKLFRALPTAQLSEQDLRRAMLQSYAAMTHLAESIRRDGLEMLTWILDACGEAALGTAGSWVKGLQTFQNLLSWHPPNPSDLNAGIRKIGNWTSTRPSSTKSASHSKLLVLQLTTLGRFLKEGLTPAVIDANLVERTASGLFPLWHTDAHLIGSKSNALAYLNLFGASRDTEQQAYETFEEREEVFRTSGFAMAFLAGVKEVKREGGEVGRASSGIEKAMRLVKEDD